MPTFREICLFKISGISLFKAIRNFFIAFLSMIWLIPFLFSTEFLFRYMIWVDNYLLKNEQIKENYPFWISISPFGVSRNLMRVAILGLGIVIFFWAFVTANKLWPIKKKNSSP